MTTPTKAKTKAQLQAAHDEAKAAYNKARAAYDRAGDAYYGAIDALAAYKPKKKAK